MLEHCYKEKLITQVNLNNEAYAQKKFSQSALFLIMTFWGCPDILILNNLESEVFN